MLYRFSEILMCVDSVLQQCTLLKVKTIQHLLSCKIKPDLQSTAYFKVQDMLTRLV